MNIFGFESMIWDVLRGMPNIYVWDLKGCAGYSIVGRWYWVGLLELRLVALMELPFFGLIELALSSHQELTLDSH
jgi:hypothetical protein